jgi:hypothetical protein
MDNSVTKELEWAFKEEEKEIFFKLSCANIMLDFVVLYLCGISGAGSASIL